MGTIGMGYGSEWHLLRYLGYHRDYLSREVLKITGGNSIHWLDFDFSRENIPLKDDGELKGLKFISDEAVHKKWRNFWPPRGNSQNWDAVGKIQTGNGEEWLLVEAKGHLGEIKSSCGATNIESRQKIVTALQATSQTFSNLTKPVENWLSPHYQYANRLAVLHFLMKECEPSVKARLLFIYFYGENRKNEECPQSKQDWLPAISKMNEWLGINKNNDLAGRIHILYLPVNPSGRPPRPATN
ncbi:MAG: hypothetical protein IAF02_14085 [Anaerolineae bacterium]|nr:hypothetical protein [Anaerolineae bacterium]